jgi:hypothetical protein
MQNSATEETKETHMSQATGIGMEEMLNTFATETEADTVKWPVKYNADGEAYCDDGSGDVLLTRAESDAADAKVEQINNLSEANDGDLATELSAVYKDSYGKFLYRLIDSLTGSTIEIIHEDQLPAIYGAVQRTLYAAVNRT